MTIAKNTIVDAAGFEQFKQKDWDEFSGCECVEGEQPRIAPITVLVPAATPGFHLECDGAVVLDDAALQVSYIHPDGSDAAWSIDCRENSPLAQRTRLEAECIAAALALLGTVEAADLPHLGFDRII